MGNTSNKYNISEGDIPEGTFRKKKASSTVSDPASGLNQTQNPDYLIKLAEILEAKSLQEENQMGICRATFQKYICKTNKSLGNKLFEYFLTKEGIHKEYERSNYEKKTLLPQAFIRQANTLLNCVTDTQQLEYYIKVNANDKEEMTGPNFLEMISAAYEVAQGADHSDSCSDNLLSAACKAVMHGKESTSCKYILNWITQHCPRMFFWIHSYVSQILTAGYSMIPSDLPAEQKDVTPVLERSSSSVCAASHPALMWLLSSSLPASYIKNDSPPIIEEEARNSFSDSQKILQQKIAAAQPSHWITLYNSDEHGLSTNRFQHHVFDYRGPTLLFITTDDESMFCLACDEEWRDSQHFYGGFDSVCFQLLPEYKVIDRGQKMIYFNISSRGFPTGLQVGVDNTNRTLCLDINLSLVHYKKIPFKVRALEVWGCGTRRIKEKQMEYKSRVNKDVENRRKVNLNMDWKDNPDRYLLEMAGTRPNYARFEKDTQDHSSLT